MSNEQIAASWASRSDITRSTAFSMGRDATGTQAWVMADLGKQGSGNTVTIRVVELYPIYADDEQVERVLDKLYDSLLASISGAKSVGGQF